MKIDNNNVNPASTGGLQQQQRASAVARTAYERSGAQSGVSAAPTDQIELSGLSKSIAALSSESPERAAKVERLATEYANGSYKVDSEAVSRKIVEDAFQQ